MKAIQNRFDVLDGLRGFAALMVLLHHIESGYKPEVRIFYNGFLAVDLFFMLSGFVIAHSYNRRLEDGMFFLTFLKIRLIRLIPLAALGTLCGALAQFGFTWSWNDIVVFFKQLFFIPDHTTSNIYPLNAIQWTLFFELLINIFYALCFSRLNNKNLTLILILSSLSMIFTGFYYGSIGVGWGYSNLWGGFARVFFGFFVGIAIYRLSINVSFIDKLKMPSWMVIIGYIVLSLFFSLCIKNTWKVDLLFCFFLLPSIVLFSAQATSNEHWKTIMYWAGALSYPVYALQGPIRHILIDQFELNAPNLSTYLITIFVVIVASYLALRFFDEPVRTYLKQLNA